MVRKIEIALMLILLLSYSVLYAQEDKTQGMPPAKVVVSEVSSGMVVPEAEFIGTVYYHEVSKVASEVSGKVETMSFDEGQRVKKGSELVKLNSDLLLSDLEKAVIDFKRAENLYKKELISEQAYDERRFKKERLEIEILKKVIRAPYDGVVLKKHVNRGEWLSPGSIVATIAGDDVIDIITEVPERIVGYIDQNMDVTIQAGGKEIKGKVFSIIPRGDISTRTFPVKIRADNSISLIEGMEARVSLPTGEKKKTLMVPRDALMPMFGNTVVFAVIDSKAKMIPVEVAGYRGMEAGILAQELSEGMKVVIKGNERLMDGQPVITINRE